MKLFRTLPLMVLAACEGTGARDALSNWAEYVPAPDDPYVTDTGTAVDDTGPGTVPSVVSGQMQVVVDLPYDYRFGLAPSGAPCVLETSGASPLPEATCQLEVNELDLYMHGWQYAVVVPEGTCEYLEIRNYRYQAWESGTGPALVEWVEDPEGNWIEDITASLNGKPSCPYDYTSLNKEFPNCCYGTYQVQITVRDDLGAETVKNPQDPVDWGGGPLGDCYAGAAFASSITALDPVANLPLDILVDIDEQNDSKFDVSFTAPITNLEASSVTVANYVDPSHPVPLGTTAVYAQQTYTVECLDHAMELYGRINLVVREWDTVAEFEEDGDPDAGANGETEPNGTPLNDFFDWQNFENEDIDWVQWMD